MGQRRLAPSGTPGRWCDQQGCVAAVRSGDGAVTIQRSDRAMLEQTLVAAPWWTGQRFVLAAVAGAALIWVLALGGAARAWWRRRRGAPAGTPGRWCDQQGGVAAVRSGDGAVTIQRSDRAMLEQTLVAAPWWTGQRFVLAAVAGAALIWVLALGGAARAWWRRRRG